MTETRTRRPQQPATRADQIMRRMLFLPAVTAGDPVAAQSLFGKSILISGIRCLITYILIPLAGPVLGLTGTVGPVLGLVVGAVSIVFIVASIRRFFAAHHKWRWHYTAIGLAIIALLLYQTIVDIGTLAAT
ncbi:MAG: hypothetical protein GEU79_15915 [Acidimicrobiia bacterium]|nr:hypothetical protein [Acidimicrobiia bacterium]